MIGRRKAVDVFSKGAAELPMINLMPNSAFSSRYAGEMLGEEAIKNLDRRIFKEVSTMGEKLNCWEFMGCGRELDGSNEAESGTCPAAVDASADGLNSGRNGGRICWAVAGSFGASKIEGTFAKVRLSCFLCDFYRMVQSEEGFQRFRVLKTSQLLHRHP